MLVFNQDFHLFLGERLNQPGIWQLPQGGVEEELSEEENVLKELNEELGVDRDKFKIARKLRATNEYEWETPPKHFEKKWRGQVQSFWLVEFLGADSDIVLDRFEPEFMNWKWCNSYQVRELSEPVRVPGYTLPLREFEDFITLRQAGIA